MDPSQRQTLLFDFSGRSKSASMELVAKLAAKHDMFKCFRVVFIGSKKDVQEGLTVVPCAAVISPCCPIRGGGFSNVQEISVHHNQATLSPGERDALLVSAAGYLQERDTPYFITKGNVTERLVAAVALETCRLAQVADPAMMDDVSRVELGMVPGVFECLDHHGAEQLLHMIRHSPSTPLVESVPVAAREALTRMKAHGLLGRHAPAGGFNTYTRDAKPLVALHGNVFRQFLRPEPSRREVADRIMFSVINECCALITDGSVLSSSDMNALSVATGCGESTGGALVYADDLTVDVLVERMAVLSGMYGSSLAPHTLLNVMRSNKESFKTLTKETISSARKLMS
jgi:3-hydroxyacyl-CoA dehydrogenase